MQKGLVGAPVYKSLQPGVEEMPAKFRLSRIRQGWKSRGAPSHFFPHLIVFQFFASGRQQWWVTMAFSHPTPSAATSFLLTSPDFAAPSCTGSSHLFFCIKLYKDGWQLWESVSSHLFFCTKLYKDGWHHWESVSSHLFFCIKLYSQSHLTCFSAPSCTSGKLPLWAPYAAAGNPSAPWNHQVQQSVRHWGLTEVPCILLQVYEQVCRLALQNNPCCVPGDNASHSVNVGLYLLFLHLVWLLVCWHT